MNDAERERERMVERQIAGRGIGDTRVLEAMRVVAREAFVEPGLREFAYADSPLPIDEGQTISQPYIVALMLEAAELGPGDRVLDVGTGSGYAAAVASRIAGEVFTIERHPSLAAAAARRFAELGYANVVHKIGDGSRGWPEAAPFDAILVAAGAPEIPSALLEQLAVGGRLVAPVGGPVGTQRLVRVTRRSETAYDEEDLGSVAFVPLIGEEAPRPDNVPSARAETHAWIPIPSARSRSLPGLIAAAAERFDDIEDRAFASLFDRFGEARIVLLGEATHGTAEFYTARAAITRRLIEKHGFNIVAVEADWPDAAAIDRYVRHKEKPPAAEPAFTRFPTWMWRNEEALAFVDWLRRHNERRTPEERAGFFGLDLYSLGASMRAVLDYLDTVDPQAARIARERYGCLTRWQHDPAVYGRVALSAGYPLCEEHVVATLRDMLDKRLDYLARDGESYFDASANARLVAAAERYYRIMYYGSADSWNLRDTHMFETLEHILAARGDESKAVVWAHNSHIGNAAATDMGIVRGEINIGQLCSERFGERAVAIGFGTDRGTVAAASDWDGPMEIKTVRPSHRDSYERLCRDSAVERFVLDLRVARHEELRLRLMEPRLERAIGVIYRPETELLSHYFDASLPDQFTAYVWFETSRAVTALPARSTGEVPETYPFGL